MKDSTVVTLYLEAKKRLDSLGFEIEAIAGYWVVRKTGKEPPYKREITTLTYAESLHAFAAGIYYERSRTKKKAKKKPKKRKGR